MGSERSAELSVLRALRATIRGRLGKDIWSTVVGNVIGALAAFFAGLVLARWLGPAGRGTFELVLFVVNSAILLLGFGLNIPTAVFLGSRPARGVWAYRAGVLLLLVYSLLAVPVALLIVPRIESWRSIGLGVRLALSALAGFLALSVLQLATAVAIGSGRIQSLNLGVVTRWLVYLIGLLVLQAVASPSPESALGWFAGCAILGCIVVWFGLRNVDRSQRVYAADDVYRLDTLSFGIRGQAGNVLQFLSYRFDVMLVGLWVGQAALGVYAVGVLFAEALWLLPNALGTVILSHTARSSKEAADRRISLIFPVTFWLVVSGGVALSAAAWLAAHDYLGSAYVQVPRVTWALMPGAIALSGTKVLASDLTGRGYPGINTVIAICTMVITVLGDVLLIPRYGIIGAAVASSVGYSASLILTMTAFRGRSGIRLRFLLPNRLSLAAANAQD